MVTSNKVDANLAWQRETFAEVLGPLGWTATELDSDRHGRTRYRFATVVGGESLSCDLIAQALWSSRTDGVFLRFSWVDGGVSLGPEHGAWTVMRELPVDVGGWCPGLADLLFRAALARPKPKP